MSEHPEPVEGPPEWCLPLPEILPRPSYAPAVLSLGLTLVFLGLVTSGLVSVAGIVLCLVGGADWIGELRHERNESEHLAR